MHTIVHTLFTAKNERRYFSWWFAFLLSIIGMPFVPSIAIVLFLGCGTIVTGSKGTQFDMNRNRFRSYLSVFFIKSGRWKPLDSYPYIYILRSQTHPADSLKRAEEKQWGVLVDIVLTDIGFREKITLLRNYPEEKGRQEAARLAALLGREFVPYGAKRSPGNQRKRNTRH